MSLCPRDAASVEDQLSLTYSEDARMRALAVKALCPCRVWRETSTSSSSTAFWDRIIEMVKDEDEGVRKVVLHTLADGSPHSREDDVVGALECLAHDSCEKIRRKARKVLNSYRRTGKLNIL